MDLHQVIGKGELFQQGAEGRIYKCEFLGRPSIVKVRFEKKYRHPELDQKLTHKRITHESRNLLRCRKIGINTPAIYFIDLQANTIVLEYIDSITLKEHILAEKNGQNSNASPGYPSSLTPVMEMVGRDIAKMHSADIIHGDLTTSNILVQSSENGVGKFKICFIDFGLSSSSRLAEDKGVDLYVLEKAFLSTHPNSEELFAILMRSYKENHKNPKPVLAKFEEVKLRGRKRTMAG